MLTIQNIVVPDDAPHDSIVEFNRLLNERFLIDPDEMTAIDRRKREVRLQQLAEEIWGQIPI